MNKYHLPPLCPEKAICPACGEGPAGHIGTHSQKERRYICHECGKTFSDTVGTPLYGLKYPHWLVIAVLTLLAYGCPLQAIVAAFGIDERTVSHWHHKAGQHAQKVQKALVGQQSLALGQVQADEMYLKTQGGCGWIATGMSVFSRLIVGAEVSFHRNSELVSQVVEQVHAATKPHTALLWATDGYSAWKSAILKRFRTPVHTGQRGRPRLVVWSKLHVVQVVKRRVNRAIVSVERRLAHGTHQAAEMLVAVSQTDLGAFNTAYIERFNATLRTWLPAATRKSRTPARQLAKLRTAMWWTIAAYNFCRIHDTIHTAPAVAAGILEKPWTIEQLIRYKSTTFHATT